MKSLMFVFLLATIGTCKSAREYSIQQNMHTMATDNFTENIEFFQTEGPQIKVGFSLHSGIYTVSKNNPKFEDIMNAIAKAWQQNAKINIELRGNEVVSAKISL